MKKLSIVAVSLLLAGASAFAWTKKSENTGNLGRMFLSISGGVDMSKGEVSTPASVTPMDGSMKSSPTGGAAQAMLNAPIFKPGINAFRDIKWAGLDGQIFFDYNYSGDYQASWLVGGNTTNFSASKTSYGIFGGLKPYLNFETGLPFLKAIKPFAIGYAGYMWEDWSASRGSASYDTNSNYFAYGVGGGVEFVLVDTLSFTPAWKWNGNSQSGLPCYQTVEAELAYWVTDQFCVSGFWVHSFGGEYSVGTAGYGVDVKHGDVIGAKFKIGFMR